MPAEVDLGAATTLLAAGVTALQVLRALGSVLGRRVLVTGASGGVGAPEAAKALLAREFTGRAVLDVTFTEPSADMR